MTKIHASLHSQQGPDTPYRLGWDMNCVDKLNEDFRKHMKGVPIETRTYNNWLTVIGAYATLQEQLELPWSYEEFVKLCVDLMLLQNKETGRNDDLGRFWKMFQYLISSNQIFDGGDYKLIISARVPHRYMENGVWRNDTQEWKEPKKLFYLNTSRVFNLYKSQSRIEGEQALPESTVEYYLKNSEAFLFETKKESFKKIDPKFGTHEQSTNDEGKAKKKYTSTSALVFDLDKLNLSLIVDEDELEGKSLAPEEMTDDQNSNPNGLPF